MNEYEEAQQDAIKKWKAQKAAVKKIDDFVKDHSTTFEDFIDLGMEAACPMIDEYKRLFVSPEGHYYPISNDAYMAAGVLNTLVALHMDMEKL